MAIKARLYTYPNGQPSDGQKLQAEFDNVYSATQGIAPDQLAVGSVTTEKLADGSVTEPKLASSSVSTLKLKDLSVTTGKLSDLSVTDAKLSPIGQDKIRQDAGWLTEHMVSGTQHDNRYFTKTELSPYLSADTGTVIKREVYTIVNPNIDGLTFQYKDNSDVLYTGTLTPEGYQVFTLTKGTYSLNQNRISVMINDMLHRSVASGGLIEISPTSVALTSPETATVEVTIEYFEILAIPNEKSVYFSTVAPLEYKMIWYKDKGAV